MEIVLEKPILDENNQVSKCGLLIFKNTEVKAQLTFDNFDDFKSELLSDIEIHLAGKENGGRWIKFINKHLTVSDVNELKAYVLKS